MWEIVCIINCLKRLTQAACECPTEEIQSFVWCVCIDRILDSNLKMQEQKTFDT